MHPNPSTHDDIIVLPLFKQTIQFDIIRDRIKNDLHTHNGICGKIGIGQEVHNFFFRINIPLKGTMDIHTLYTAVPMPHLLHYVLKRQSIETM